MKVKKYLLGLASLSTIVAPIATVVACTTTDQQPEQPKGVPIDLTGAGVEKMHAVFHNGGWSLPEDGMVLAVTVDGAQLTATWHSSYDSDEVPQRYEAQEAGAQGEILAYVSQLISLSNPGSSAGDIWDAMTSNVTFHGIASMPAVEGPSNVEMPNIELVDANKDAWHSVFHAGGGRSIPGAGTILTATFGGTTHEVEWKLSNSTDGVPQAYVDGSMDQVAIISYISQMFAAETGAPAAQDFYDAITGNLTSIGAHPNLPGAFDSNAKPGVKPVVVAPAFVDTTPDPLSLDKFGEDAFQAVFRYNGAPSVPQNHQAISMELASGTAITMEWDDAFNADLVVNAYATQQVIDPTPFVEYLADQFIAQDTNAAAGDKTEIIAYLADMLPKPVVLTGAGTPVWHGLFKDGSNRRTPDVGTILSVDVNGTSISHVWTSADDSSTAISEFLTKADEKEDQALAIAYLAKAFEAEASNVNSETAQAIYDAMVTGLGGHPYPTTIPGTTTVAPQPQPQPQPTGKGFDLSSGDAEEWHKIFGDPAASTHSSGGAYHPVRSLPADGTEMYVAIGGDVIQTAWQTAWDTDAVPTAYVGVDNGYGTYNGAGNVADSKGDQAALLAYLAQQMAQDPTANGHTAQEIYTAMTANLTHHPDVATASLDTDGVFEEIFGDPSGTRTLPTGGQTFSLAVPTAAGSSALIVGYWPEILNDDPIVQAYLTGNTQDSTDDLVAFLARNIQDDWSNRGSNHATLNPTGPVPATVEEVYTAIVAAQQTSLSSANATMPTIAAPTYNISSSHADEQFWHFAFDRGAIRILPGNGTTFKVTVNSTEYSLTWDSSWDATGVPKDYLTNDPAIGGTDDENAQTLMMAYLATAFETANASGPTAQEFYDAITSAIGSHPMGTDVTDPANTVPTP